MATPSRRTKSREKPDRRGVGQQALADAAATALFCFCFGAVGQLSTWAAPWLGLSPGGAGIAIVLALLIAMGPVCDRLLGGALYNPANAFAELAQGRGTWAEHVVRSVAQSAGGVVGVWLALWVLPPSWTKALDSAALGVRPGATLLGAAACEFVLGSVLTFVVLASNTLRSSTAKLWLPLLATVVAVKAGEDVSGPSLNPAFTFAHLFVFPWQQSPLEHALVYWAAPLAAAMFGGWAFLGWQQQQQQQGRRAKAD